jgi:hypothetical protein
MTRNGNRDVVGGACTGHRTDCLGSPDPARNVSVTGRFARGDLAQCLPYFSLKYGSANVKGQFDIDARRFDKTHDACHQLLVFLLDAVSSLAVL